MAMGKRRFALRQKRFHCKLRIWIQICQLVTIVCATYIHVRDACVYAQYFERANRQNGQLLFVYGCLNGMVWHKVWHKAWHTHGQRTPQYLVDNLFCNHTLWAFCYHYHYRHNYCDLVIKFMKCIRPLKYSQRSSSKKPTKPIPLVPLSMPVPALRAPHISVHQSPFLHALSFSSDAN